MKNILTFNFFLILTIFIHQTANAQGSCFDGSYNFSDISVILDSSTCDNCHTGGSSQGNWNYDTYAGLIAAGNCGVPNVVPGNALGSLLYDKIDGDGTVSCGGAMPNGAPATAAAFSSADLAAIEAWINAGALENCTTCPTVILNDNNLPTLPPAVCADDLLSLCFDVIVDENTFDPTLVQFGYELTIDGVLSSVTLNTTYTSGGAIDPAANGQLCFEATVPIGSDPCMPYDLELLIIDVFYNDPGCDMGFVGYDLNITTPIPIMQTGNNLNDLIPLLELAGLNPIEVEIFPNPNWTATVTQAPACDGVTLGIIEISSADGTVCETLTDIGTAGMDGCPKTDAILPETLYENYTTFTDADGMDQPNPCAVSITIPEQTITCEDQCIICPAVVNVIPPDNICPDATMVTFCVEFDMVVDVNTVLTVEGIAVDGSAGGTQICVDVPFTAPFNPCDGAAIDYTATAVCDGTDLLAGQTWLSSQILPITDAACGGIAGCMDMAACNFNPGAVCDDPAAPCLPAPTCNTDPCVGDTEIIDPNDACACIVDEVQVLGCTDMAACNFDMAANCNDNTCDLGNTACADPCNEPDPDDGCALTTDTFDAATCTVTNEATCPAGEVFDAVNCACVTDVIPGCTDPCADNYDMAANEDNGSCNPYDTTCNTDCTAGDLTIWDATTCSCIVDVVTVSGCTNVDACNFDMTANCDDSTCDLGNTACTDPCNEPTADDGCDLTTDTFDAATCTVTNTPNCAAGETFDATNCLCTTGTPGCLDPCDPNYDSTATIDDPALCAGYDTTCNTECLTGDLTIWDAASCSCIVDVVTVLGCTDMTADNYEPTANCDDGTCVGISCEDTIAGSVIAEDTGCSAAGIEVTIYDSTGAAVGTAVTDASGNYVLTGVYTCGEYTAQLTANVPDCYVNSGGTTGPIGFTVDGDGTADGANFNENPQVPTLSQWGLIILALLLMTFGALSMGFQNIYIRKESWA